MYYYLFIFQYVIIDYSNYKLVVLKEKNMGAIFNQWFYEFTFAAMNRRLVRMSVLGDLKEHYLHQSEAAFPALRKVELFHQS